VRKTADAKMRGCREAGQRLFPHMPLRRCSASPHPCLFASCCWNWAL